MSVMKRWMSVGLTAAALASAAYAQPVTNLDTAATFPDINSALAAPGTLSGHTLQVAPGTYGFSTTVGNGKAVTIQGSGSGSNPAVDTILNPAGDAFDLNTGGLSVSSPLVLRNMRLTSTSKGVRVGDTLSFVRIENMAFLSGGDGIDFNLIDPQVASDVQVLNCNFTTGGNGVRTSSQADVSNVTISGCVFDGDGAAGILTAGGASGGSSTITNWRIANCQIRNHNNSFGAGIWLKTTNPGTVNGFAVDGCLIEDNGTGGAYVNPYSPFNACGISIGARTGSSISGVTINNTVFRDTAGGSGQYKGILMDNFAGAGALAPVLVSNCSFPGEQVGIVGQNHGETVCLSNDDFSGTIAAGTFGVAICGWSVNLVPEATCYHLGDTVWIDVNDVNPAESVVGGQFSLSYDSSKLAFVDALPGSAPFTVELYQNSSTGSIDYGVGVPSGNPGSSSNAMMARLKFTAIGEVCSSANLVSFRANTPPTRLTNAGGFPFTPTLNNASPFTIDSTPPVITCSPSVTTNGDAGVCTAALTQMTDFETAPGAGYTFAADGAATADRSSVQAFSPTHSGHLLLPSGSADFAKVRVPVSNLTLGSGSGMFQTYVTPGSAPNVVPYMYFEIDSNNNGVFDFTGDNTGDSFVIAFITGAGPIPQGRWFTQGLDGLTNVHVVGNRTGLGPNDFSSSHGGGLLSALRNTTFFGGTKWGDLKIIAGRVGAGEWPGAGLFEAYVDDLLFARNLELPPTAADLCDSAPLVTGARSDLQPLGSPFSNPSTVLTWTATDTCGNSSSCTQNVTLSLSNTMVATVQLEGVSAGPFTRCITFGFDTGAFVSQAMTFTGGVATANVNIPCNAYTCVTARDRLHTLRRTANAGHFGVTGTQYFATFTGTDQLIGGNLNDDNVIDILDFGAFIGQYGQSVEASTTCNTPYPHADISGDGTVGPADFTYIQIHFFNFNEPDCFGITSLPGLPRISVPELIASGRGDLVIADLNHDGWLDEGDMAVFAAHGGMPACSADFNGDGDIGTDADIEAFFACLAGNCCHECGSADFDGDGDIGTDADIETFFRVLAGGPC